MKKLLIVIALALSVQPMFGQKYSLEMIVEKSGDTIWRSKSHTTQELWDAPFYDATFRKSRIRTVKEGEKVVKDTVVEKHRLQIVYCGNYRQHRCHKVYVTPLDTSKIEPLRVFSVRRRDNIHYEIQNRREELISVLNSQIAAHKPRHPNIIDFSIGQSGVLRYYNITFLDSTAFAQTPLVNLVKVIDTLNKTNLLVDWVKIYPADTLEFVYPFSTSY